MKEMEVKLYLQLEIPFGLPLPGLQQAPSDGIVEVARDLEFELNALSRTANRIGRIPEGYPRHITWIIRVIAALLPWYTRPLADFGRRASVTAETTSRLIDEILRRQDSLAAEIRELREAAYGNPKQ